MRSARIDRGCSAEATESIQKFESGTSKPAVVSASSEKDINNLLPPTTRLDRGPTIRRVRRLSTGRSAFGKWRQQSASVCWRAIGLTSVLWPSAGRVSGYYPDRATVFSGSGLGSGKIQKLEGHRDGIACRPPCQRDSSLRRPRYFSIRLWDLSTGQCDRAIKKGGMPVPPWHSDQHRFLRMRRRYRLWDRPRRMPACLWATRNHSIVVFGVVVGRRFYPPRTMVLCASGIRDGPASAVLSGHRAFMSMQSVF